MIEERLESVSDSNKVNGHIKGHILADFCIDFLLASLHFLSLSIKDHLDLCLQVSETCFIGATDCEEIFQDEGGTVLETGRTLECYFY